MRTAAAIMDLADKLRADIEANGWDAQVGAALVTLEWVCELGPDSRTFAQFMARPDAERRREWIARGGNPDDWPLITYLGGRL